MPSLKEKKVANLDQKENPIQKMQFDSKWATQKGQPTSKKGNPNQKGSLAQKQKVT
jgi:hypothetical protein